MKDILFLLEGLIAGIVLWKLKDLIFKKASDKAKSVIAEELPGVVAGVAKAKEEFNMSKLIAGITSITNKVNWGKTLTNEFSFRTIAVRLAILGIIAGVIFGYGWYKGKQGVRPILDLHGKEEFIQLNEHYLHVEKDGSMEILDKDKKTVLKKISIRDIGSMKDAIRPYGLQLVPVGIAGIGLGEFGRAFEAGVGVSFAKFFQWEADTFATNKGAYLGVSHTLDKFKLRNSSIGVAYGKGWKGDNRVLGYFRIKF